MAIAAPLNRPQCRWIAFRSADNHSFYIEFSMEENEFIAISHPDSPDGDKASTNRTENDEINDILNGL